MALRDQCFVQLGHTCVAAAQLRRPGISIGITRSMFRSPSSAASIRVAAEPRAHQPAGPPQPRRPRLQSAASVGDLLRRQLIRRLHSLSLPHQLLGSLAVDDRNLGGRPVSPFDRKVIVGSELGRQVSVVAGLGNVIEP